MKNIITVVIGVLLSSFVFPQNKVVYGEITIHNTYPVKNVEFSSKKGKATITTDSLGQFSDSLIINLIFIDSKENRELAVGFGYINEDGLTYAVGHLEQKNYEYCNYPNMYDLIKGKFAGVVVSNNAV